MIEEVWSDGFDSEAALAQASPPHSRRLLSVCSILCQAAYLLPIGYGLGWLVGQPVACEILTKTIAIVGLVLLIRHEELEEESP